MLLGDLVHDFWTPVKIVKKEFEKKKQLENSAAEKDSPPSYQMSTKREKNEKNFYRIRNIGGFDQEGIESNWYYDRVYPVYVEKQ